MHKDKIYTIGNYKISISGRNISIEAINPNTILGFRRVNGIQYDNGNIACDYPEWLPTYVKREIIKIMK